MGRALAPHRGISQTITIAIAVSLFTGFLSAEPARATTSYFLRFDLRPDMVATHNTTARFWLDGNLLGDRTTVLNSNEWQSFEFDVSSIVNASGVSGHVYEVTWEWWTNLDTSYIRNVRVESDAGTTFHDQYYPKFFSTESSSVNPQHVAQDGATGFGHPSQINWEADDDHFFFNDTTFNQERNRHLIATGESGVPKQTWPWWLRFELRGDESPCCLATTAEFRVNGTVVGQASSTSNLPAQWQKRSLLTSEVFAPNASNLITWKHVAGSSTAWLRRLHVARGDNSGWADPATHVYKDQYYPQWWGDDRNVAFDGGSNAIQRDPGTGINFDSGEFVDHELSIVPMAQTFGTKWVDAINPSGTQSDPVNSATGAFVTSATDLSLAGTGVPFEFMRSYTSRDGRVGVLGRGWRHGYEAALDVADNGDVLVSSENGQQIYFHKQSDGSFKGDPGALSRLTLEAGVYELARMDDTFLSFDSSGRMLTMKDRNGQGLTFSHTGSELTGITDSAGRQISLSYTGSRLTHVGLPDGRGVTFGYTGGLLTTVTDSRSGITTYGYDASNLLKSVVDQEGHPVVTNTYNSAGRVTQQADGEGNISSFSWDAATKTSTMTDARSHTWKDTYFDLILKKREDPLGNVTEFEHNQRLDVVSTTDPRGNTTTMTYDPSHYLLKRTAPSPLSYVETFDYNANNDLVSHTDGRSNTTTFDYDAAGNLVKITKPGAVVTEFTRSPTTGLVTAVKDPRGKTTAMDYDAQGNLTKITTPLGHKTTMSYDSSGRMTSLVEARGNAPGGAPGAFETTFAYDAADHLISMTDPLGNQTEWDYALDGTLSSQGDAKNRATAYGYDDAHRLTSVTAPDLTVTAYGYDASGNLTSRTDANSHTTTYDYDVANRLNEVSSPTGQVWSYDYDANGNLSSMVDARGNATPTVGDFKTIYAYDVLNRLTGIDYSDSTPDVGFDYDANSNRVSMTDGAGTETYTHDALNRLTDVTRGGSAFTYAYDAASNITARSYPDGTSISNTYDDDSRLASVSSGGKTTSYGYDPAGRITTTNFPTANGVVETRVYDRAGRLSEIASLKGPAPIASALYQHDEVGNPTRMTTLNGITTYSYDALDRLTGACLSLPCSGVADPDKISYTYDAVGNRITEQRSTGLTTHSYNAADELTSSVDPAGTTNYTHDANGNLTSDGSRSFTYDLANRMATATVGTTTTTYGYDGAGKRVTASAPSNTVDYKWDPNAPLPQLVRESNGSGGLLRRYLHGNDLISQDTPGASSYFHHDGIGSVVATTSDAGVPQRTYSYEPFGKEHLSLTLDPTAPDNLMRFTGELFDQGTGLYHLRARQYDPGLGRFTARDPVAPLLKDPYVASHVYANNRPVALTDPSGLTAGSQMELCSAKHPIDSPMPSPSQSSQFHDDYYSTNQDADAKCLLGMTMMWSGFGAMAAGMLYMFFTTPFNPVVATVGFASFVLGVMDYNAGKALAERYC